MAAYVDPSEAREVRIGVGSDDGFKLWVNGEFIGGENAMRSLGMDTNRYDVKMQPGRNLILLKVVQGGGPTGWSLRLTDLQGKPLKCSVWMAE
ncbi:MAG: hypothetical protein FJ272_11395 [Planctomycetes bacterium]|nr:hypothetical protein [Planctomycetota bacterium]